MRTHYNNLKVGHRATPEEIRKAYKRLAQKHHPDRNSDSAYSTKIMKIINEAYDVLSDPVKRAAHDADIAKYKQEHAKETHFQQPKPEFTTDKSPREHEKDSGISAATVVSASVNAARYFYYKPFSVIISHVFSRVKKAYEMMFVVVK